MTFVAPWLIGVGLIASSIPIVIHLFARRRFVRVQWAPMRYLQLAVSANRRRMQLEHLLLLGLRVLVLLSLFTALARPVVDVGGWERWLRRQRPQARILVIDDSLSMQAIGRSGTRAFDRARAAAQQIVRRSAGDELTVLMTSRPQSPLFHPASTVDEHRVLLSAIESLVPSDTTNSWSDVFQQIDACLAGAARDRCELILITDAQDSGWSDDVLRWTKSWDDQRVHCCIVDVEEPVAGNLACSSLRQITPVAVVGHAVEFSAAFRWHGTQGTPSALDAKLDVDGRQQSLRFDSPRGMDERHHQFQLVFDRPGLHRVQLRLPSDSQMADNTRQLIVDVRASIKVQLVDGDPHFEPFAGEVGFLAACCRAGQTLFEIDVTSDETWELTGADKPDVVVLANVGWLDAVQAQELYSYVAAGGGLVIFSGDAVDPQLYNALLSNGRCRLLPSALKGVAPRSTTGMRLEPHQGHPLQALERLTADALARIRPRQVMEVADLDVDDPQTRVLAHWQGSPICAALLERRVGAGRVYLWTTTADRDWSDWPLEPSYLLATIGLFQHAAAGADTSSARLVGETLHVELPHLGAPDEATLLAPGSVRTRSWPVRFTSHERPCLLYDDTRLAGFYHWEWVTSDGAEQVVEFAVNPHAQESRQDRIEDRRLAELLGPLQWQRVSPDTIRDRGDADTQWWRPAIWMFLALVGCESLVSAWTSRER